MQSQGRVPSTHLPRSCVRSTQKSSLPHRRGRAVHSGQTKGTGKPGVILIAQSMAGTVRSPSAEFTADIVQHE